MQFPLTTLVPAIPVLFLLAAAVQAEELDMVNRPVNASGLTGLIMTTAPHTIARGSLEIGVSALSETSADPEYTLTEYPLTITYGMARNAEIALKGSYLWIEDMNNVRKRGEGDMELLSKWNFIRQKESSLLPAAAAIVTLKGLTGDAEDGFNRVHNWGASIGLSVGSEISWEDHVLGIYIDSSIAFQDLNRNALRDRYGIYNAGIILPISKQHNLQLLMEYSVVSGKRFVNVDGGDSSTTTYGLRLVSESFNLTVGSQFIHKELEGFKNSGRVIGILSIKF